MPLDDDIVRVLRLYGDACQPRAIVPVDAPESFSGARLWRVAAERGELCLRQWPARHPTVERLEFIQAVLWHADQEGFRRLPLPLETHHHHGYVWHAGCLWELNPWLPGTADYHIAPTRARLAAALKTLAEFHEAVRHFPLPESNFACSPGIEERCTRLSALLAGGLNELRSALRADVWPELEARGRRTLALVEQAAPRALPLLESLRVAITVQPCIRDITRSHVLFAGDEVTGIVDFGSMRPDHVATDVARLLGSMAGDDRTAWRHGLASFQTVRRLTEMELKLVEAFDRGAVILSPIQWLEWIFLEGRQFARPAAVLARFDELQLRLESLAAVPQEDMLA